MRLQPILLVALACAGLAAAVTGSRSWSAGRAVAGRDDAAVRTGAVANAATAFLATLGAEQRRQAHLAFVPQPAADAARFPHIPPPGQGAPRVLPDFVGERYGQAVWSNYPVSDVPRPGVRIGTLDAAQRAAAMRLLQTLLSPQGYRKVLEIMGSDQVLSEQGQSFAAGTAVYTIAIFGDPSTSRPWMVELGGHHLGLNIVIAGRHGVMTPTLTGAQPAVYTANGKTVRALAAENDTAFALLASLDANQKKQAILSYRIDDLVAGPGHAGETIVPEGLKGAAMTPPQKALLMTVIAQWAGIIDGAYSRPRMDEIRAGLDDTWFAWSGPTTHQPGHNGSAYYRIQGPKLLIEFSPQGVGGDATMHVHTMYRDPTNDYGAAYTHR